MARPVEQRRRQRRLGHGKHTLRSGPLAWDRARGAITLTLDEYLLARLRVVAARVLGR